MNKIKNRSNIVHINYFGQHGIVQNTIPKPGRTFSAKIHHSHPYFSISSNISDAGVVKIQERKLRCVRDRISLSIGNISTSTKTQGSNTIVSFFHEATY